MATTEMRPPEATTEITEIGTGAATGRTRTSEGIRLEEGEVPATGTGCHREVADQEQVGLEVVIIRQVMVPIGTDRLAVDRAETLWTIEETAGEEEVDQGGEITMAVGDNRHRHKPTLERYIERNIGQSNFQPVCSTWIYLNAFLIY